MNKRIALIYGVFVLSLMITYVHATPYLTYINDPSFGLSNLTVFQSTTSSYFHFTVYNNGCSYVSPLGGSVLSGYAQSAYAAIPSGDTVSWAGTGAGSYSGTLNPATFTMESNITETATCTQPSSQSSSVYTLKVSSYPTFNNTANADITIFPLDNNTCSTNQAFIYSGSMDNSTSLSCTIDSVVELNVYLPSNPTWSFAYWAGTGSGSYSGASASTYVALYGNITEIANFRPSSLEACNSYAIVYQGQNVTCSPFTVRLENLSYPNSQGLSNAAIDVYYDGILTNQTAVGPEGPTQDTITEDGYNLVINVPQTFPGLYAYQKWAKISLNVTTLIISTNKTYTINLQQGWNLYSIPVINITKVLSLTCGSYSLLSVAESPIWKLVNGNYEELNAQIYGGAGFWEKLAAPCTVNIKGPAFNLSDYQPLTQGWNMIGSPAIATSITSMEGSCNIISGPYGYNTSTNSYYISDILTPGNGYFVDVSGSCSLGTPGPSSGTAPPPPP